MWGLYIRQGVENEESDITPCSVKPYLSTSSISVENVFRHNTEIM